MNPPNRQNRRRFLRNLGATTGALAVPYFMSSPSVFASDANNDRPLDGCISIGSMGYGPATYR